MTEDLALFGPEEVVPVVKRPEEAWGALAPKWTRCTSKTSSTRAPVCSHCVAEAKEQGVAPQPLRAVWRRKGPNGEDNLCVAHAQLQRELDARAAALAKAREDINKRTPAARKRREGAS